ncbi:unnamed protein product [Paramecium pentaurelia]|uniref:ABC transporter family protein n=1 Tax=Paramecium pentaurelia TaxID=43138 RepID=A0A8S1Y0F4_9CILI|nr:unnamed protein product [Paramecium pentaurelia]
MNSNLYSSTIREIKEERQCITKLDCLVNEINIMTPNDVEKQCLNSLKDPKKTSNLIESTNKQLQRKDSIATKIFKNVERLKKEKQKNKDFRINSQSCIQPENEMQFNQRRVVSLENDNKQKSHICQISIPKSVKQLKTDLFKAKKQINIRQVPKLKERCTFIKELFFISTIKAIIIIYQNIIKYHKTVDIKDLPQLSSQDQIEQYSAEYVNQMRQDLKLKIDFSFYNLFFWKFNSCFTLTMLILGMIESNSNFIISLLLYNIIENVQDGNKGAAQLNALYLTFLSIITIIGRHYQYIQLSKFGGKLRQILMYILIEKISTLSNCSIQKSNSGSILNIICSDLSTLEWQYGYIYCIPIVPFSLLCSGWILWLQFQGPYGLMAVLICVITYPTQTIIQKCIQTKIKLLKEYQDLRLKQQTNFLDNIQTIKMYCWQETVRQMILKTRFLEWKQHIQIQILTLIDRSINQSINIWGSFLFLIIIYNLGIPLNLQKVILTIQLMGSIRYYCVHQVSYGLKAIINLNVIFKRIKDFTKIEPLFAQILEFQNDHPNVNAQSYLELSSNKEMSQFSLIKLSEKANQQTKPSFQILQDEAISIRSVYCYWELQRLPLLKNINFIANRGQLISIIGKTGSGKTTFLQLILKEIPYIQGQLEFTDNLTFGYVEQEPFINPTTIKDNILFGREYNKELFDEVLKASNFLSDLNDLPESENTVIGDNGATLSGGQRARLSLARALYAMPNVYLFDDPLSAVDSKVAKHIFSKAIQQFIFQYQPTKRNNHPNPIVIMTTHQLSYALKCDYIVVLEDGQIICQGRASDVGLQIEKILNVQPVEINENSQNNRQQLSCDGKKKSNNFNIYYNQTNLLTPNEQVIKTIKKLILYVTRSKLLLILSLNILTEIIRNLFYRLLTLNADDEGIKKYALMISILVITHLINNVLKYSICSYVILDMNNEIFSKSMQALAHGKKSFFDKQPSGIIINKYSTDLSILDNQMPIVLIDIFEDGCQFIVSLLMIGFLQPFFFLPIMLTLFLSYILFKTVVQILSQLKINDLSQRAPQLSQFKIYIQGLTHYRLSNQFNQLKQKFFILANNSFQSNYIYHQTQKCFSQYVDLIALFTKTSGTYLIIAFIEDNSLFSQALLLLQSFHAQNTLLRQLMELSGLFNSYERLLDIQQIDKEKDDETISTVLPRAWPKQGSIVLKNLSLQYYANQQPVLKNIDLEIKPEEKIAFVGRTGAGKSSLISALFRLVDIGSESSILIDGCNVRELSLNQLRRALAIIPQQPLLFYGSIKQNLDPQNLYTDLDIWKALSEVNIDGMIEQQKQLLNCNVMDLNLSAGQKQQLCLARVILMRRKILILDEASANIDILTDEAIQEIIRSKFMDCTILTIAHRLNTIAYYDRVIVLENGQIAEQGNPFELLSDDYNAECINKKTKFAEMVLETGNKNAQQIFVMAKESYYIKQLKKKQKSKI